MGTDSNPSENPKEPEEDSEPAVDPQLALQRSRYGRVLKPKRDSAFDYSAFFVNSQFINSDFLFMFSSSSQSSPPSATPGSQPPATVQGSAFSRLRRELLHSGERVFYVETPTGPQWMVLLRETGTIMVFDAELGTFYNAPSETLYEDLRDYTPWPRKKSFRALTREEVELPASLEEFPGWTPGSNIHLQPRYGYTEQWLDYIRRRAALEGRAIEPLSVTEALESLSKSAPTGSVGPTPSTVGSSSTGPAESARIPLTVVSSAPSVSTESTASTAKLSSPAIHAEPVPSFPTTTASDVPAPALLTTSPAPPTVSRPSSSLLTETPLSSEARPPSAEFQETPPPLVIVEEVPNPLTAPAPDSPLAGHILDVSLRAALLNFAHTEGDRMVVDADRLLDHCRELGYGLIGAAVEPTSFANPLMDTGGFEEENWDDDETLGAGGAEVTMEDVASAPASAQRVLQLKKNRAQ